MNHPDIGIGAGADTESTERGEPPKAPIRARKGFGAGNRGKRRRYTTAATVTTGSPFGCAQGRRQPPLQTAWREPRFRIGVNLALPEMANGPAVWAADPFAWNTTAGPNDYDVWRRRRLIHPSKTAPMPTSDMVAGSGMRSRLLNVISYGVSFITAGSKPRLNEYT